MYGRDWVATFGWLGMSIIGFTFAVVATLLTIGGFVVAAGGNLVALIFSPLGAGVALLLWAGTIHSFREMLDS